MLIENRHGLVVDGALTRPTGTTERDTAIAMVTERPSKHPDYADKLYDNRDFVANLRVLDATPRVAQNDTNRRSAIDRRTTRHSGYTVSHRVRKRIEENFGRAKSSA